MSLQFLNIWLNKPDCDDNCALTGSPAAQDEEEFILALLKNFKLPEGCRAEVNRGLRQLAPRQRQVLILLCQGWGIRQIAACCGISAQTARNHIRIIYSKVGLSSRSEVQAAMLGLAVSCQEQRAR